MSVKRAPTSKEREKERGFDMTTKTRQSALKKLPKWKKDGLKSKRKKLGGNINRTKEEGEGKARSETNHTRRES